MSISRMKSYAVVIGVATTVIVASGVVASAALPSQFSVANGTVRPAKGTPHPTSGNEVALWSNKSVATTTLTGSGQVIIGAIADNCQGSPIVRVTADGKVLGDVMITDPRSYGSHPVGKALANGTHAIKVQFMNDYLKKGVCDRNVFIGSARLLAGTPPVTKPITTSPTGSPTPTRTASPTPTGTPSTGSRPTTGPTTTSPATGPDGPTPPVDSSGKPGPSNTGVPAGTKLTVYNGDLRISKAGTVIDGLDIRGFVDVEASNVTIRNSIVRGRDVGKTFESMISNLQNYTNLLIEDTTILPSYPTGYNDGLKGHDFTARRVDVSKVVDTSQVFGNNVTIEDSWFHDDVYVTPWPFQSDNQTHSDNLQIQGGTNIQVIGNTFEKSTNTAIMITQDASRTSNVQITDNWLSGGVCTVNIADKGKGPITGLVLKGNQFGASSANCQMLVNGTQTNPVQSDNVNAAASTPIVVQRR